LDVVEVPEVVELDAGFVVHVAPSLVLDYQSFPAADAVVDVVAFDVVQMGVT
jgi:hypothetical protein